jgi:hypothetical protein
MFAGMAACEAPYALGIKNAPGSTAPIGGGAGTTPTPPTPPGLDTLPAPPVPIGSPATSPRIVAFALADASGTASVQLGPVTSTSPTPNITCFASTNPTLTPWASVPAGTVLPSQYCVVQIVGTTAFAFFASMVPGEYVAAVAKF